MPIEKPHPDAVEKRELRSANSKSFALPDGKVTVEVRRDAVCYVSDEGELRSCDTTVQQSDGKVFVEWLPYKFELHQAGIGFDFRSRESGFARVSLAAIGGEEFDINGSLKPVIEGNLITFTEVRPGVDIVFKILPNRVKTLRIIKNAEAARDFEWLCEHDADGRDKIDDALTGTDAAAHELELLAEVVPIDDGSFRFRETWTGNVKLRDKPSRIKSLSSEVVYPVEIDPTVSYNVGTSANDGWETAAGAFNTAGNIYFGRNGSSFYTGGWQFPAVNVPQGATITSATMSVVALFANSVTGTLFAEDADNPVMFSAAHRPTLVARTTASTAIATPVGLSTFTITAVVQEIVNRAGWVANNHLNIMTIGDDVGTFVTLTPYSTSPANSAQLSITYTEAPPTAPTLAVTGTADNGTYAFGNVPTNEATSHQFTITNTGDGDDTLGTLLISGTGWSIDAADDPSGDPLAASGTTTVTVIGNFATAGEKTGILTIPSDDADSPYVVNLTATAVAPSTRAQNFLLMSVD